MSSKNAKILMVLFLLTLPLIMSGCFTDLIGFVCDFNPDSDHCFQFLAVQKADPYGCEKIQGEKFKDAGSNPPKDKCYLMIAENTGDYKACEYIQGGLYSYTKEECYLSTAIKNEDPSGCKKLSGVDLENCRTSLSEKITADKLTEIDDQIKILKDELRKDPSDPNLIKQLSGLEDKRKDYMDVMNQDNLNQYTKGKFSSELSDVEDSDVKSEIAKAFVKYRMQSGEKDIDKLMEKLKDIKEEKEYLKSLDEQANELVDLMKEKASDYVDGKKEEIVDAMKEKGWKWVKDNGGDRLKYGLSRLEDMKSKYDKASEQYKQISDQIAKIKKAYDEVKGVYDKIDKFNEQVKQGKISQEHAKVLKGAVLLGKGLEYATSYVPVFGSTISKVSSATFETTIKFANKRAQRSNSLQKCLDDPDNCDPDGITAY